MSAPKKYRKKPVVVEAMQFDGENGREISSWIRDSGVVGQRLWTNVGLEVETLEGTMRASDGDYIIRGVQGKFYPCKSDIFEATYEAADDGA